MRESSPSQPESTRTENVAVTNGSARPGRLRLRRSRSRSVEETTLRGLWQLHGPALDVAAVSLGATVVADDVEMTTFDAVSGFCRPDPGLVSRRWTLVCKTPEVEAALSRVTVRDHIYGTEIALDDVIARLGQQFAAASLRGSGLDRRVGHSALAEAVAHEVIAHLRTEPSADAILVTYQEAARRLGTTVAALKTRVSRGDPRLTAAMVPDGRSVRFNVARLNEVCKPGARLGGRRRT